MPAIKVSPSLSMYYEDDYFGDPWIEPEIALLVHGVAESSRSWYGWVPHLARSLRVLRPDLRGFGGSTVPEAGYAWSTESFGSDLVDFLDAAGLNRVHVISAKLGGTIAMQFAADHPERVRTLSVVSSPVRSHNTGGSADLGTFPSRVRAAGVRGWAAETQRARLGSEVSQAQIDWWNDFMGTTDPQVCVEVTAMAGTLDISAALPAIQAPALVITTEASALASVDVVRGWQQQIPHSELLVMPGDSYHIAAAKPDECAEHVLAFINRHRGDAT